MLEILVFSPSCKLEPDVIWQIIKTSVMLVQQTLAVSRGLEFFSEY